MGTGGWGDRADGETRGQGDKERGREQTTEGETWGMGDPSEIRYAVTVVNFTGQAGRKK